MGLSLWMYGCVLLLVVGGSSGCTLKLHEESRADMTGAFARAVRRGSTVVRFHLYLLENGTEEVSYVNSQITSSGVVPFKAAGNDTFAPYLWVWARKNGKYILRVPMDYHVMSFGIISLYIDDMDVVMVSEGGNVNCTETLPYAEVQHMVASLLHSDIVQTSEPQMISPEADVIARSAYTFRYYFGRVIGVKGCERNTVTGNWTCESLTYMKGWEMTWFGPLAVTALFYIFILLTIYKEYISYKELRGNDRDIQKKVSIIEQKILRDVKRIRRQLYGNSVEEDFIEFLKSPNFLDILGVSKKFQKKVIFVVQIIVGILLLGAYYGVMGYSIYYHGLKNQRRLIGQIANSHEIYANVFGHLAWLYADPSVRLKTYALVEAIITGLVPLIMVFLYVMFTESLRRPDVILPEKKDGKTPKHHHTSGENGLRGLESEVEVRYSSWCQAFANSKVGVFLSVVLLTIVIVFWLFVGGVYLIFTLYMIGVGSFLTLNLFAGWMLPACLCVYYAYEVFTPLFELYTISKQKIFAEIHKREYLVKTDDYMLCPTSLIEKFYYGISRGKVFEGFQRVFVALALLLMLFLVFIASQYPDFDIRTKNSNLVMGVNIAIILPFLAGMMQSRLALTDLEKEMLAQDIAKHVTEWEAENEAMVEALKIRVQKLKNRSQIETPAKAAENSTGVDPAVVASVAALDTNPNIIDESIEVIEPNPVKAADTLVEPAEISEGLEMNELTPFLSQSREDEEEEKKKRDEKK